MNEFKQIIEQYSAIIVIIFLLYTLYLCTFLPLLKRRYQVSKIFKQLQEIDIFYQDLSIETMVNEIYEALNEALKLGDESLVKEFLTPHLYENWLIKMNWVSYSRNFNSNRKSKITTCLPIGIKTLTEGKDEIWIYVRGHHGNSFYERKVVKQHHKIVNQAINKEFIEYWKFIRDEDHLYLDKIYEKNEINLKEIPCTNQR